MKPGHEHPRGLPKHITIVGVWLSLLVVAPAVAAERQREQPPAVLGRVPGRGDELTLATPPVRRVLFELRLAELEPVRGLAFEATVKNSDRKIFLHYVTVITNADVKSASVVETAGRFEVALTLTPEGTGKMAAATSRHVGRPLAIVLDGEVVSAPTVREPIGSKIVFGANFTADEAKRIVTGLERW